MGRLHYPPWLADVGPVRGVDPSIILTAHWRADSGITNSSGVSAWLDRIGGLSAAETTNKPTFTAVDAGTGQPCVSFDGVNDKLTVPAGSFTSGATTDRTWMFVRRCNNPNGNYLFLALIGTETLMSSGPAGHCGVNTVVTFSPPIPMTTDVCVEIYRVVTIDMATTVEYWRDGYLFGTATITRANLAALNLILCSAGAGNYGQNDLFEWGVSEIPITNSDIAAMTAYAVQRYGFTPQRRRSAAVTIMCFGDSITGANTVSNTHAWREDFAGRVQGASFVGTQQLSPPYTQNEGVGGDAFAAMQARLAAALAANPNPTIMLILGGVNDAFAGSSGSVIATAMRSFVEAAAALSPRTIFGVMDCPPNATGAINTRLGDYNTTYMDPQIWAMAAAGINVRRVTSFSSLTLGDLIDGTHPNGAGSKKAATFVAAIVAGWVATA